MLTARGPSRLGAEHWLRPMREHHPEATGHHAAALVIGRRIRSALLAGVSAETPGAIAWDVSAETSPGQARVLLADLIDWHRRKDKPAWWRYFYLRTLSPAELTGEPDALGGLAGGGVVGQVKRSVVRQFRSRRRNTTSPTVARRPDRMSPCQLISTISSVLPSGSRNQNIGGTGPMSSTAPIRIAAGAPARATSASTSMPARLHLRMRGVDAVGIQDDPGLHPGRISRLRRHEGDTRCPIRRVDLYPAVAVAPGNVVAPFEPQRLVERERPVLVGRWD
jgi:hypothetical protein